MSYTQPTGYRRWLVTANDRFMAYLLGADETEARERFWTCFYPELVRDDAGLKVLRAF